MQFKFIIISALLSLAAAKEDHSAHDTESVYTYTTLASTHEHAHSSTLATSTVLKANTTIPKPHTNYVNSTTTAPGFTNSTISVKPTATTITETTADLATTTTESPVGSTSTRAAGPSSTNAAVGGRSSQFGLVVLGAALAAGFGL
ncbi:hypothetical protein B0T21DRAFT_4937 [Apiosordaria backusii]|uniref:Uncharacterized protein n=1 Tax=Apiosordaria backusii TaxID=314023 RepID=A0AA40EY31_9PEZI|nr:hypothetical protein B0T21DRAFT_4937 [Apiosordaria backusii]